MTFEQIISEIENLSRFQGFYKRLLDEIFALPEEEREKLIAEWEGQNFQDTLDFIMYIEG